jgi:hypothetical protein
MSTITTYTTAQLDLAIQSAKERKEGHYGRVDTWLHQALDKHLREKHRVLLIGSCEQGFGPWYEGMILDRVDTYNLHVTDYNEIKYEDTTAVDFIPMHRLMYESYDVAIAISVIEHSGLGRYGDALDEDGDIRGMAFYRAMLSLGGLMFLAVPIGLDNIIGNQHRIYGRKRLPKLLKGWKMIDSFGFEDHLLDRDTKDGWRPLNEDGTEIHPGMPEYSPILVLEKA